MKWILGAVLSAIIGLYFADEMLQNLGLAALVGEKWQIKATGWHILAAMWPIWGIIAVCGGLFFVLFLWFFLDKQEELAKDYEEKLKQGLQDAHNQDVKLADEVLHMNQQNNALEAKIKAMHDEKQELVKKINHQHSTVQRLHKKIDKLKSSF